MLSILIIEDSADYAAMLVSFLRHGLHREHDCYTCPTIAAALSHLRDHPAGLIILDLGLPDAAGLSGVRQVYAAYPEAPMLVITGHINGELAARVEAIGPQVHFLTKDEIRLHDFSIRVRAILDTSPPPPAPSSPWPRPLPTPLPPQPIWYPYVRDGLFAVLIVGLGCGLFLMLDDMRQEHVAMRHEQKAHVEELQKTHTRMERVMGELIQVLSKRSNY